MTHPEQAIKAATVAVPSTLVAWFAETLPLLQWAAAALAIVVSLIGLYRTFKRK